MMFIEKTCNIVVVTQIEIPGIYNQDQKYNSENSQKINETMAQNIEHKTSRIHH
jgi:hypothetical protein